MDWQTLTLFAVSSFLVSATPGANMLFAFQMGLNHGFQKTLWVMAGLSVGLAVLLTLALLGLGLIAKYPMVLTVIKVLGALYLIYLGVLSWQDNHKLEQGDRHIAPSPLKLFQGGVWISLSNPKAMLFFAAFFPKFINFSAPLLPQYAVLIALFFVMESFWQVVYALGGIKFSTWLNHGKRMLYLNRLCGLIFMGIGAMLIYESVFLIIKI